MPITTPANALVVHGNDRLHFRRVADHIFKPAAEEAGFEFKAPTSTSSDVIQAEIIQHLHEADLVLCDISTLNANVFFELGIRVALDKPVAMVRDDKTEEIPFDNSIVNCHTYNSGLEVWRVQDEIPKLRDFLIAAGSQNRNALWKYFGITQRAEQAHTGSPEEAKWELLLTEISSLRKIVLSGNSAGGSESGGLGHKGPREISAFVIELLPDADKAQADAENVDIFSREHYETSVTDHVSNLLLRKYPQLEFVRFYGKDDSPYQVYKTPRPLPRL